MISYPEDQKRVEKWVCRDFLWHRSLDTEIGHEIVLEKAEGEIAPSRRVCQVSGGMDRGEFTSEVILDAMGRDDN